MPRGRLAKRTENVTASLIGQLALLAKEHGALDLSEGFPNYPAPDFLKEAAVDAINGDYNQYSYRAELCRIVAENFATVSGLPVDPTREVALACGQTGAFSSAIFAVIDPGDEVVIMDPSFETYGACVTAAGGIPVRQSPRKPRSSKEKPCAVHCMSKSTFMRFTSKAGRKSVKQGTEK